MTIVTQPARRADRQLHMQMNDKNKDRDAFYKFVHKHDLIASNDKSIIYATTQYISPKKIRAITLFYQDAHIYNE